MIKLSKREQLNFSMKAQVKQKTLKTLPMIILETSTFFRLNNPIDEQEIPADTIAIRYQVNGTCNRLNDFLAECKKYYIQGQNLGQTDDHFPASNKFKLPYYADGSRLIKVSVNDNLKMQGTEFEVKQDDGVYM